MIRSRITGAVALIACCGLVLLSATDASAAGRETRFNGDFNVQPNGDAEVMLKFQMPMEEYQNLRENISNLYLLLRELASSRSDAEVTNKHAEHDDANRTVTFTMTMLGAGQNRADHWEFPVEEGLDFSNLDQDIRTLYFTEIAETVGGAMRGSYRLVLPEGATAIKWDEGRRLVSYVMPLPEQAGGGSGAWLAGMAMLALGLAATVGSFFVGKG